MLLVVCCVSVVDSRVSWVVCCFLFVAMCGVCCGSFFLWFDVLIYGVDARCVSRCVGCWLFVACCVLFVER